MKIIVAERFDIKAFGPTFACNFSENRNIDLSGLKIGSKIELEQSTMAEKDIIGNLAKCQVSGLHRVHGSSPFFTISVK